jgi:hypothetical protein
MATPPEPPPAPPRLPPEPPLLPSSPPFSLGVLFRDLGSEHAVTPTAPIHKKAKANFEELVIFDSKRM